MNRGERHCENCETRGPIHLCVRNHALRDKEGRPRIGCWNTVLLTACGLTLGLEADRHVTLRVDMTTCDACLRWAMAHDEALKEDDHGRKVTA